MFCCKFKGFKLVVDGCPDIQVISSGSQIQFYIPNPNPNLYLNA